MDPQSLGEVALILQLCACVRVCVCVCMCARVCVCVCVLRASLITVAIRYVLVFYPLGYLYYKIKSQIST